MTSPSDTAPDAGSGATRLRVLRAVVEKGPEVDLAGVAAAVGGHPNGSRRHLESLVNEKLIEASKRMPTSSGRPATVYTATDQVRRAEATSRAGSTRSDVLALLTKTLASTEGAAEKAREVGREWGAERAGRARGRGAEGAVAALREQGFARLPHTILTRRTRPWTPISCCSRAPSPRPSTLTPVWPAHSTEASSMESSARRTKPSSSRLAPLAAASCGCVAAPTVPARAGRKASPSAR